MRSHWFRLTLLAGVASSRSSTSLLQLPIGDAKCFIAELTAAAERFFDPLPTEVEAIFPRHMESRTTGLSPPARTLDLLDPSLLSDVGFRAQSCALSTLYCSLCHNPRVSTQQVLTTDQPRIGGGHFRSQQLCERACGLGYCRCFHLSSPQLYSIFYRLGQASHEKFYN